MNKEHLNDKYLELREATICMALLKAPERVLFDAIRIEIEDIGEQVDTMLELMEKLNQGFLDIDPEKVEEFDLRIRQNGFYENPGIWDSEQLPHAKHEATEIVHEIVSSILE